jgi:hypothetical protein
LILHGAVVLLAALLYGAPYARAIQSGAAAQVVNSWRVAHQSMTLGAVLMFSVAGTLPLLLAPVALKWLIAGASIVSAYAFAIATPLAAITKNRGLTAGSQGWARLVYGGNIVGAWTSLVSAVALLAAAAMSI